ncbi:hypothetical protein MP638_004468 [Amoeboaphelidium occidentale]|nr:hypothetical protein MP638_004468 [Amoeboaphelidium occidentale]
MMEPKSGVTETEENIIIKEGKAEILFSKAEDVFYNPVQEFNRDMSIAVIRTWAKDYLAEKNKKRKNKENNGQDNMVKEEEKPVEGFKFKARILEALSATGLRSIRYGKELADVVHNITANDISKVAVDAIAKNVTLNGLSTDFVRPSNNDACALMYQHISGPGKYDVIDLDPYGTSAPFMDAAVQAIAEGGLLCVTCTDMAVLAGKYPDICFAKYGGAAIKADFCHEMALRLVLRALQSSASRYKRIIVPLMSCSIDFYVRVFVKVVTSPAGVKKVSSATSNVYHCTGCKSFYTSPINSHVSNAKGHETIHAGRIPADVSSNCNICSYPFHVGGPFWSAPIHDKTFVSSLISHLKETDSAKLYGTHARMLGMSTVISEELDTPFYYTVSSLAQIVKASCPSLVQINSALLNAGYNTSFTHCAENSIKTDAPPSVIWEIMRTWAKESGASEKNLAAQSPGFKIRAVQPKLAVSFKEHPNANPESRKVKLVRFEDHAGMSWGPKARAKPKR